MHNEHLKQEHTKLSQTWELCESANTKVFFSPILVILNHSQDHYSKKKKGLKM